MKLKFALISTYDPFAPVFVWHTFPPIIILHFALFTVHLCFLFIHKLVWI